MDDDHDLQLKKQVFFLADVFDMCLEYYGLVPCCYLSSPGLSWDAMLKMTGIELKLNSDIDIYLVVNKRIRGGVSYIVKSCSKANNKYMKSYDDSKSSKYIMYQDTNNLYGQAISQYFLTENLNG